MITKTASNLLNNQLPADTKEIELKDVKDALVGGYVAKKSLDHGLHRLFGLRGEFHTTTTPKAKAILNSGGWLDPAFGGTGNSKISPSYQSTSKNYVHITGTNNKSAYKDIPFDIKKIQPLTKYFQKAMYTAAPHMDIEELKSKKPAKILKEIVKGLTYGKLRGSKTLHTVNSENFYNGLIPDTDDIALKSTNKLKVYRSRLGATLSAIKNNGLSGLRSSGIVRPLIGAGVLATGGYTANKMISPLANKLLDKHNDLKNSKASTR